MKAVVGGKLVLKDSIMEDAVLIYNEKIEKIVPASDIADFSGMEILDANGHYISPGLIDLHIHGIAGVDIMDGNSKAVTTISNQLPHYGVTAFVPTTMTMAPEVIDKAVQAVREYMKKPEKGAEVLGVHLEGPFISAKYKGAQNEQFIQNPSYALVKNWLDIAKLLTFAPELEGAEEFIEEVTQNSNTVLSIGHSGASYEVVLKAYEKGVKHITHCFNAMSPLHHRAPGVVGAALAMPFTTEIVCDGFHMNPTFFQGFINIKGLEHVVLITDCIQAGDLPDGEYTLGGQKVFVDKGAPRLEDGSLAGSTLKLNKALYNLKSHTQLTIPQVIQTATYNPAVILGVSDRMGSIEIGKDANFFIHDQAFDVQCTIGKGNILYKVGC